VERDRVAKLAAFAFEHAARAPVLDFRVVELVADDVLEFDQQSLTLLVHGNDRLLTILSLLRH